MKIVHFYPIFPVKFAINILHNGRIENIIQ